MSGHIAAFRDAIAAAGLTPPAQVIDDGKRRRFASNGKAGDDSGWYILHGDDRPAGAFGCWRGGVSVTWKHDTKREFSQAERDAWRERMQRLEAERDAERKEAVAAAAAQAAKLWAEASETQVHPYAERKQIRQLGVRVYQDMILVPMKASARELVGLQRIYADGTKLYLKGTPAEGAYCTIGTPTRTGTVVICEGWATGVSIHMATGFCVVVAFAAGNLKPVTDKIARALPSAALVIAADDDAFTEGNPGRTAAAACGRPVAFPAWSGERGKGTDFNDLHLAEGLDAVRRCFEIVAAPDRGTAKPGSGSGASIPENTGSLGAGPIASSSPSDQAVQGPAIPAVGQGAGQDVTDDLMIFTSTPMKTAQLFHDNLPEGGRILYWRGEFYSWDGTRYVVRDRVWIDQRLYHFMASCVTIKEKDGLKEVVAFNPKSSSVNDVAHALRAVCYADLPEPQCWIDQAEDDPPAGEIIAFRNGFLHWPTRKLLPATDRLFVTSALGFDYQADAPEPVHWFEFLHNLWPTDAESITALADMFGYMLTDDTSQQKMFMLIGPPRSGKGTILRVLESLVGYPNRVSPSLASLGTQFGLQPLIGKRLAMISDARLSGKADQQPIVENLLRISGEDSLSIDRKNIAAWTGKLPTRFVLASNELPAFSDASAALANRFMIFTFTESFLGREDMGLTGRLLGELPGIVMWALDGLERLQKRGYLIRPQSSEEYAADLIEQTSPMRAFVSDRCMLMEGERCSRDDLFGAWRAWCEEQGREHTGTKATFGRQLSAAFPALRRAQPRTSGVRVSSYSGIRLKLGWEMVE